MNTVARIIDSHTIKVVDLSQFTEATLWCGQVFRFREVKNEVYILETLRGIALIDFEYGIIECTDAQYFFNYFDFQTDYNVIANCLSKIEWLPITRGIRILRQDFFECAISFIISANNNIKRFSKTLNLLFKNKDKTFLNLSEEYFKHIGCGYRSAYLVGAIKALNCNDSFDITACSKLSAENFIKKLLNLPGVGKKVASCIALFSDVLSNEERFCCCPIDVHINRAFEQLGKEQAGAIIKEKYVGVAQQYLFYNVQYLKKEIK